MGADLETLAERYRMALAEIPDHHIADVEPDHEAGAGMWISRTFDCPGGPFNPCQACCDSLLSAKRLVEPERPIRNPEIWGAA